MKAERNLSGLPTSTDELFGLDDGRFVATACEIFFGPEPAPALLQECERLLRGGWSKSFVLGNAFDAVSGTLLPRARFLEGFVNTYRKARGGGWIAWYYRHVYRAETDSPDEVTFRRFARECARKKEDFVDPMAETIAVRHGDSDVRQNHADGMQAVQSNPGFAEPLISVILRGSNGSTEGPERIVRSVRSQAYSHWQLILCVSEGDVRFAEFASRLSRADSRIIAAGRGGDDAATPIQRALESTQGTHVVMLNGDAALEPGALQAFANEVAWKFPDFIYSDSTAAANGAHEPAVPVLRPAYSRELHRARNYLGQVICYRTSLLRKMMAVGSEPQSWLHEELLLRFAESASHAVHVPQNLYRLEAGAGSGWLSVPDATQAKRILLSHLKRCEEAAEVALDANGTFDIRYTTHERAKVAIIIPTKDQGELVDKCVLSIERTVAPGSYTLHIVDHESTDPKALEIFARLARDHEVLRYRGAFNFSAINNWAVAQIQADCTHYLFCNNDIEAIGLGWLERMISLGEKEDVAVVGAKLLYPDQETIQHAGVCFGMNGVAGHYGHFLKLDSDHASLNAVNACFGGLSTTREMSAVTGACMLMRRDAFEKCGGFDEQLADGFGDVDLCLRARQFGYRVLFCAQAELVHHESVSRGKTPGRDPHPADTRFFAARWQELLRAGDPYFNPSLSLYSYAWEYASRESGEVTDGARFLSRSFRKLVSSDL